jgi:hypothetical protein
MSAREGTEFWPGCLAVRLKQWPGRPPRSMYVLGYLDEDEVGAMAGAITMLFLWYSL